MTAPVIGCGPEELITEAMSTMTARRFRHMPVIDGNMLAGIVSIGDLVKHRLRELEDEASDLRTYIASV
jgi:CBS domain-containing protein